MICPTCKSEGARSRVTLVREELRAVPAVYWLPQWDEDGKRIPDPKPPEPKRHYECSLGHRFVEPPA